MKKQSILHKGIWLIAVVMVIAFHGTILYYVVSHFALSAVLISGLAILLILKLVIAKRRGLTHSARALFHRTSHH